MGEEDLVLETEEPLTEDKLLPAEETPVSLLSELEAAENSGAECTRCIAAATAS